MSESQGLWFLAADMLGIRGKEVQPGYPPAVGDEFTDKENREALGTR